MLKIHLDTGEILAIIIKQVAPLSTTAEIITFLETLQLRSECYGTTKGPSNNDDKSPDRVS
jgi:hypothetical protein